MRVRVRVNKKMLNQFMKSFRIVDSLNLSLQKDLQLRQSISEINILNLMIQEL
jgi:hypothetical protein